MIIERQHYKLWHVGLYWRGKCQLIVTGTCRHQMGHLVIDLDQLDDEDAVTGTTLDMIVARNSKSGETHQFRPIPGAPGVYSTRDAAQLVIERGVCLQPVHIVNFYMKGGDVNCYEFAGTEVR